MVGVNNDIEMIWQFDRVTIYTWTIKMYFEAFSLSLLYHINVQRIWKNLSQYHEPLRLNRYFNGAKFIRPMEFHEYTFLIKFIKQFLNILWFIPRLILCLVYTINRWVYLRLWLSIIIIMIMMNRKERVKWTNSLFDFYENNKKDKRSVLMYILNFIG